MDGENRRSRLQSFVLGGLVGASAALAAVRRRRPPGRVTPAGLAAFEGAPCYHEVVEAEISAGAAPRRAGESPSSPSPG